MPEPNKASEACCRNCGKPLGPLPAKAPHKAFCGSACRNEWHEARRKKARALLEATEKLNAS